MFPSQSKLWIFIVISIYDIIMGSIYGIVIPRRLKEALKSGNWIQALSKFRNKSDTLSDLKKRSEDAFEELILLAEKMPRRDLADTLPPENIVKLVASYLQNDPEEERLRLAVFEQSEMVRKMENSEEIRVILQRCEQEFRRRVDAIAKKRNVSVEEQALIRTRVEKAVWSTEDVLELQRLEHEKDAYRHLENEYANHNRSVDSIRTKLAGDIAIVGTTYCSAQVVKIIEAVPGKGLMGTLDDAIEVLAFIAGKVSKTRIS